MVTKVVKLGFPYNTSVEIEQSIGIKKNNYQFLKLIKIISNDYLKQFKFLALPKENIRHFRLYLRSRIAVFFIFLTVIFHTYFGIINNGTTDYKYEVPPNNSFIERVVNINGGDGSKSGPGARAKADAARAAKMKANKAKAQSGSSGSNFFAQAFGINNQPKRSSAPKAPSARAVFNQEGSASNQSKLTDAEGYTVGRNGRKQVDVHIKHQKYKLESPLDLSTEIESLGDVLQPDQTTTQEMDVAVLKRQIHKKHNHKGEVPEQDPKQDVTTYKGFKDNQVSYMKTESPDKFLSDGYLLGEGSRPKKVSLLVDEPTRTVVVIEEVTIQTGRDTCQTESVYVGPRVLSPNQWKRFLKHGVVGNDGGDVSGIRHGMSLEELQATREK